MLSLTVLFVGMFDRSSSDYVVDVTYNCFSSTITDTGHTNKTKFLNCIDDQNKHSDLLSSAFLIFSAMLIFFNILQYFGNYYEKSKHMNKK